MAVIIKRRRQDGTLVYRVQDRTTGYPSLSETFASYRDAKAFKVKAESDRQAGQAGIPRGRRTLKDAVKAFTETAEFRERRSGDDTRRHLEWWCNRMGPLPIAKITPDLVAENLHRLEADGLSGSTVNRYRSALSRLFRYCIKTRHWLPVNPCAGVERRQEGRRRERVIRPKEWKDLLTACETLGKGCDRLASESQLKNFLRVIYGTAARNNEARHLRWEYVDLEAERVTFHDTKGGGSRTVPLIGDALAAVTEQGELERDGVPWVFPSAVHDDVPVAMDAAFRTARKKAGLDQPDARGEMLVIHSLRHSAATEAGKGGASAFEIMALTGHRTLVMAHRYTKTGEEHALAALRKRARH